ncbi:MAG TPA: hypothetical protein VMV68_01685, partial [Spirochaetia bacterium]|nr:hypothetical protein [Spirochaetia bacterium]
IGKDSGIFELHAAKLIPEAQVFLRSGNVVVPAIAFDQTTAAAQPDVRTYRVDLTATPPGQYDLLISNSQVLGTVVPHLVTVKPEPIPRLTSSSLSHALNTNDYPDVVLHGENLEPVYKIAIRKGGVQHDLVSRFVSAKQMDVDADFRGLDPGTYQLLVQDSGRVVASLPGGIDVTPPVERFVHPSAVRVTLGYPYAFVLTPSFSSAVTSSDIGGELVAALPMGVKFFPNIPVIRDMGFEVQTDYSLYGAGASGSGATPTTASLNLGRAGVNLYYRTPFNFPVNGLFRFGYGATLSGFARTNSSGTASGSSVDYFYQLGAGAEVDIGARLTMEIGAVWWRVMYGAANLDSLAVYLRGGVRLGR